jgi:hypothetical protein
MNKLLIDHLFIKLKWIKKYLKYKKILFKKLSINHKRLICNCKIKWLLNKKSKLFKTNKI